MDTNMNPKNDPMRPILVVDDDEGLRKLITRTLNRIGFDASGVETGGEAVAQASGNPELLLLLDQKLHDMTGNDVIKTLRDKGCHTPFVMMTGQGDERLAVEMMKLGASDYLVKDTDFLDRLPEVLHRVFRALHTEEQLKQAQEEKIQLQEQLNQSQKLDAIGQLAGGMAHDFNNILGGIIGAAELLSLEPHMPDHERQEYLTLIVKSARHGAELVHQLLTFSRKGPKERELIDCADMLSETVAILRRTIDKSITISVNNSACSTIIMGDPSLLQSAFLNLGINASHAMPNGGKITFSLSDREIDHTDEFCSQFKLTPGKYIKVSVEDTGCGMSAETQKHIFEPFFTTKGLGKGTGLGLSAVYGAIRSHNGAIKVYSEEGMGTVFNLYFPLAEDKKQSDITLENQPIPGTGTILLVDDENIILQMGKRMLESLGYQVITASNGSEGLSIFKEHMDRIDLVILDMIMPVMGGRQTFTNLKNVKPDVKILLSSGFLRHDDLPRLKSLGLNGFIRKPYNRFELSHAVSRVLNQ